MSVLDRFLRYVAIDTPLERAVDELPEHARASSCCCACWPPSSARIGLDDVTLDEQRLPDGDDSGDDRTRSVPVDRIHRARRHLAGDAGDRRPAARAPLPTTAATSCCPTIPSAVLRVERQSGAAVAVRPRHRHRLRPDAARRGRQGGRRGDRHRRRVPDAASGDPARPDPHRVHAGRGDRTRRRSLRRRSASARPAPTRSTAARAASSSTRASPPTR